MRITLLQRELAWREIAANRDAFARLMDQADPATDLFVLPEMFTTGFSMQTEGLAETHPGESLQWMKTQAGVRDAALAGSVMVRDGAHCYNRLYFVMPDGSHAQYDKRHLFRMGSEEKHFAAGDCCVSTQFRGVRIGLQVCYDLRFPVWSRRRAEFDYDLLVYVANWPAARAPAWRQLLAARAIENQAYVAGVNRIGPDGNGVAHQGDSVLHDPLGATLLQAGVAAGAFTAQIDLDSLTRFRERFPAHLDADAFTLAR